jgi:hypothetical protein
LRYIDIAAEHAAEHLDALAAGRDYDFFCLNESDTPPDRREVADRQVREFLEFYFPFPSVFEKE